MKEFIAYQTVDVENDIWCNEAILFETEEKVIEFFNDPEKVLKTLGHELEPGETIDNIKYKKYYTNDNEEGIPYQITYSCIFAGDVRIANMSIGFIIR